MLDTGFDPRVLAAEFIRPGLDEMAPGPAMAALLSSVDLATVSGFDRVVVLRAYQKMASHYQANMYTAMAAITDSLAEDDDDTRCVTESAAAEIRAALHLTRRAADSELSFALDLNQRLPTVHALLTSGAIDVRRARTIDRETCHLTVSIARSVVERIATAAPRLTTGQLAARIRRLCIEADTHEATKRYDRAVDDRRIVATPTVDGTTNLEGTNLPPNRVASAMRRINTIARTLRRKGEPRTMDQLRADIYLDLLTSTEHTTSHATSHRGVVHITTDLDTLAGLTDHPGELDGYGPVIADIARQIADHQPDAQWRYTVTDTKTGEPLHTGTTRYRPTATQRRHVESHNPTCVFPGCRMPATDCDLDHTTSWAEGGPTTPGNLAPLCRPDHLLKHNGWTLQQLTNNRYQWTSKLGHTYNTWHDPP